MLKHFKQLFVLFVFCGVTYKQILRHNRMVFIFSWSFWRWFKFVAIIINIYLLLVYVGHNLAAAVWPANLELSSKLTMTQATHQVFMVLQSAFLSL